MTFILQKIIWFLILPPSSLLIMIVAGLLLINRLPRQAKIFMSSGAVFLYLLSLGHVADLLLRPIEGRYHPLTHLDSPVDAVVVPGGGSVDLDWLGADPEPNAETLSRLVLGIKIAGKLQVPLVLCGGNGEPFTVKINDADVMAAATASFGMPLRQVLTENVSRNTVENSYAVRKLVTGDRIILATSAYHMPRAAAMFSRRGFTVIPAPTYFLAQTRLFSYASFIPKAGDLARSTTAIAEWMSMAWWTIRGEI